LRRKLWKEHLGLLKDKPSDKVNNDMLPLPIPQLDTLQSRADKLVQDPLNDETLELWQSTSSKNTEAFRHVFHCVPDDNGKNTYTTHGQKEIPLTDSTFLCV
jgi:phospholipase D1/2